MARAKDWALSALVLLIGRGRPRSSRRAGRIVPRRPAAPRAELAVLGLLGLSSLSAIAFIVVYALDRIPAQTQFLGLSLGLALLFLAAALIVADKTLVPEEELEEPYPPREHPIDQRIVTQLAEEGVDSVDRRSLLKLGLLGAGGALTLAAITPALSFGPVGTKYFYGTPWRRGRRLVDEDERLLRAAAIEPGEFYTAFPEGADRVRPVGQ